MISLRKSTFLLIGVLLFSAITADAQTRKYSNEFLSIGVGGRALGMSGAQVASVNDVTSGYWNPTGLLGVKSDLQVGAMHSEYFAGIAKYDFVGFAKAIDTTQAIGLSFIRFGVDDIPNTTELIDANGVIDYDRVTRFSAADYAFILSYARKLGGGLSIGGNAKVIHRTVGDFGKAWGFGLDASLRYTVKKWTLGAMVRDVTTTVNAWSYTINEATRNTYLATGNEIPVNSTEITLPKVILGVTRTVDLSQKISILGEVNFDISTDGKRNVLISADPFSVDPHLGIEGALNKMIFLRFGIGNIQEVQTLPGKTEWTMQPNFGVGIKLNSISLDYALTDIGDQSVALYSNVFSLRLDIFKPDN